MTHPADGPPAWGPPPPAPPLRPDEERTWAILAHVLPLLGLGFVPPLVVWLVFRGRGPFLEHHAKESLNFQLASLVALALAAVVAVVTFGLLSPVLLGVLVAWVVLGVLAAVAASRWEWYRYPLTIRFVP
ncbi:MULTISPECIES: DUF4870 domain-containing protein [Cellulomonas]|uniref:Tic20 family protein n=2 Tax=Actinomycetes TaxID=1760 RepID=A0ABU0GPX4_9CELL|nr:MULTISPECIES: DUF4870 domain-containing protein [Cellulomonas]MBO9567867.1 DUF4870 domain-containing protein [Cellulomonas iranensis]MDQ0426655.1 putative Tic20 family protein [Cellulomonas iranensis]TFH74290.1 DUF4870 domain-containing protein [Cellulomonas sp. HD19AZ1]UCN16044.1 DUF4870 domain-containing protein [Cellulomonas iranensis]